MSKILLFKLVFILPILFTGSASLIHSIGYLHGEGAKRRPWFLFYFLGTVLSMLSVVLAESMLGFIIAWEAMGLFSSGLVGFESETKESKKATWIYLLSCQAGGALLILAGAMYLKGVSDVAVFYLLLAGFGLKIGFPPFHVWLPEAHPAAPAPASAVMSGAMIPLGFYGLLKWSSILTPAAILPHVAYSLLVLGLLAALGGILFALPQRNIKKLLAFSSVENMGVISLALSLGAFLAMEGMIVPAEIAFAGAMLHVVNHAFLKGSLFLGAGSVLRMTGTLDSDKLGGLLKRAPITGSVFTLSAFALSGLPPLPAFLSEFAIYLAAILALSAKVVVIPAAISLIALALTGGIAAAAYAKIVSGTFLGESRTDLSAVKETSVSMIAAQLFLFLPAAILLLPALAVLAPLWILRNMLLPRAKDKPRRLTWDCGYEKPSARMAWTPTAFSQPLSDTFKGVLQPRTHVKGPVGLFPKEAAIATETDDALLSRFWNPIFLFLARRMQIFHLFQSGSLHFYVLVMILAIIALLIWGALV